MNFRIPVHWLWKKFWMSGVHDVLLFLRRWAEFEIVGLHFVRTVIRNASQESHFTRPIDGLWRLEFKGLLVFTTAEIKPYLFGDFDSLDSDHRFDDGKTTFVVSFWGAGNLGGLGRSILHGLGNFCVDPRADDFGAFPPKNISPVLVHEELVRMKSDKLQFNI